MYRLDYLQPLFPLRVLWERVRKNGRRMRRGWGESRKREKGLGEKQAASSLQSVFLLARSLVSPQAFPSQFLLRALRLCISREKQDASSLCTGLHQSVERVAHCNVIISGEYFIRLWVSFYWLKLISQEMQTSTNNITVESRFLEPPRETKIGLRNGEFKISGVKLQWNKSKGNDSWFKLLGIFEKSKVQEIGISLYWNYKLQ